MGAWGVGPFDSDHALDWLDYVIEGDDPARLRVMPPSAVEAEDFDFSDLDGFLASCEVMLGLRDPSAFEARWRRSEARAAEFSPGAAAAMTETDPDLFVVPERAVEWVMAQQGVEVVSLLREAATILAGIERRGAAFSAGYWRRAEDEAAWRRYLAGLKARVDAALRAAV